jgi:two-component system, OmpR family, phosphate regulon sensor histidine kinase PhoR
VRQIISKIDVRSAARRARIGDILMLGSLRSAQARERVVEPVSLRQLLDAVLQDVQGLAAGKQVSVNLAAGEVSVLSDPKQLKILFSNLISNAIVYSHEGQAVDVGAEEEAQRVRIRVADHGVGISDRALPRIFEDFFRAPEATAFNPNSTGLGLAIVRQVARNLGLAIAVESEPGKGTVFQVFIPTR